MWVSAPQANLRDKMVTLYTKTGIVHNGEKVEVLEKQRRFVRVRTASGAEGWLELRYLVDAQVFRAFQALSSYAASLPSQGHATTRASLNIHLTASRGADVLYQLKEGDRVEILKRAVAKKLELGPQRPVGTARAPVNTASSSVSAPQLASTSMKTAAVAPEGPPPVFEDWWLVRDSNDHAGWVLARMLDLDVPLDIAQYAEGQRIIGCFALNEVQDGDKKVPQYLTLVTEPHDGMPYDFDQIRVFTWNVKRHRYETAYRERKLDGVLPVKIDTHDFGKEGVLPVFTVHVRDESGVPTERTYRLMGPIVRRVLPADQQASKAAADDHSPVKTSTSEPPSHAHRRRRHRR
jgi:SH3-like domain-containing protein